MWERERERDALFYFSDIKKGQAFTAVRFQISLP